MPTDPAVMLLAPDAEGGGTVRPMADTGARLGPARHTTDLPALVAELEAAGHPRWVWPATAEVYPALLAAGARVERCHDLNLVEAVLLGRQGAHDQPRELAAALARHRGLPPPPDRSPPEPREPPALFTAPSVALPDGVAPIDAVIEVFAEQQHTIHEHRVAVLAAAESAGSLTAAEMTHHGLPWDVDVHRDLLVRLLGPRPVHGERPRTLATLAGQITEAFGGKDVNPDHPGSVLKAFAKDGVDLESTRARALRNVDHSAVAPLLEYKELARFWVAHGWSWLDSWVHDGRFRPQYVVGGVVSGRWATRGGAALQLPRMLRTAVRADPGWTLVAADASQLEPRVLAALSGDRELAALAASGDLYDSLATDSFGGQRTRAKVALLSAMYGGTSGEAGALLATLRKRFPSAVGYVEDAARKGEAGVPVRSVLGRTSPPPSAGWLELTASADPALEGRSRRAAREWGRFTRNFVVQASAADWALVLLATLRRRLSYAAPSAELVFFQHDEVIVHCLLSDTEAVRHEIALSAAEATMLVFGDTPVRFPLPATAVRCYADAK